MVSTVQSLGLIKFLCWCLCLFLEKDAESNSNTSSNTDVLLADTTSADDPDIGAHIETVSETKRDVAAASKMVSVELCKGGASTNEPFTVQSKPSTILPAAVESKPAVESTMEFEPSTMSEMTVFMSVDSIIGVPPDSEPVSETNPSDAAADDMIVM